jgi:hypothetical protein
MTKRNVDHVWNCLICRSLYFLSHKRSCLVANQTTPCLKWDCHTNQSYCLVPIHVRCHIFPPYYFAALARCLVCGKCGECGLVLDSRRLGCDSATLGVANTLTLNQTTPNFWERWARNFHFSSYWWEQVLHQSSSLSSKAVFSSVMKKIRDTVALLFVCGNYCPTMD